MALIKCYECGKEISDKAAFCPHCGAPKVNDARMDDFNYEAGDEAKEYEEFLVPKGEEKGSKFDIEDAFLITGAIGYVIKQCLLLFWMFLKILFYVVIVIPFKILTFFLTFNWINDTVDSMKHNHHHHDGWF